MKRLILFFLVICLSLLPAEIWAQETSDLAPVPVLQKESLAAELLDLNNIYRGQLTEYRAAEKEFVIARDHYLQLQTLAAINNVTEAAKKVLGLRNQVLITYLDLLRVNLIAAEGVEISAKELVLERLSGQKLRLQSQQTALSTATDREQINQLADTFTKQAPELTTVSQQTVSLLSLGKLQNVFDRLRSIREELLVPPDSQSSISLERSEREIDRLNQALEALFVVSWAELSKGLQADNVSSFYSNISKTLNPIYTNLTKLVAFLEERMR